MAVLKGPGWGSGGSVAPVAWRAPCLGRCLVPARAGQQALQGPLDQMGAIAFDHQDRPTRRLGAATQIRVPAQLAPHAHHHFGLFHVGDQPPKNAYTTIAYQDHAYWIDARDFDSKFAFSTVQSLIALAETSQNSKAPVVTIPAN